MANGTERAKTRVGNGRRNRRYGNAEQATHEETGNETVGTEKHEMERRYGRGGNVGDGARRNGKTVMTRRKRRRTARDETEKRCGRDDNVGQNGKTVRTRRKRRADGARRNGKTVPTRRKRRVDGTRRNGKTEYHEREVSHKRGGGKSSTLADHTNKLNQTN